MPDDLVEDVGDSTGVDLAFPTRRELIAVGGVVALGPYSLDGRLVRSNITEGVPGAPLQLQITVQDAGSCQPLPGAAVDIG